MPRIPAIVCVLALASAGCTSGSGDGQPSPTGSTARASSTSSPATPPPAPTAGPSAPVPDVQLPADAPATVEASSDIARLAADRFRVLAPPDAEVVFTWVLVRPGDALDQVALVWRRGQDVFAAEIGLVLWQPFADPPTWRAVYAFTDRPRRGVLGIRLEPGDVTGDEIADLLSFEDTGGSGACGRFRVIASVQGGANEILREDACDTEIVIVAGDLVVREAVYEADDPHCCPSAFRTTTLHWDGARWLEIASDLEKTEPAAT